MQLRGVSHLGIGVTDIDRSIHFYRDVLGLEMLLKTQYDETPHLLRYPDEPHRHAAFFKVGQGDATMVLVLGTRNRADTSRAPLLDEVGVNHFAFWVDDIEALHRRLIDAGVEVRMEPFDVANYLVDQKSAPGDPKLARTMFFHDPDGLLMQADQMRSKDDKPLESGARTARIPSA
jgi:catechol 2,3-dioxygenase-like lactoylglutathione lyase family enzyme